MKEVRKTEEEKRIVMMTLQSFVSMLEMLQKIFDSAGLSMIYQMGKEKGIQEAREGYVKAEEDGDEHTKCQLLEKALERAEGLGWGRMCLKEFDLVEGVVTVSIEENPFKTFCQKLESEPIYKTICFFLRGYIAGMVSEIIEQKMDYKTSMCIGQKNLGCKIVLTRVN